MTEQLSTAQEYALRVRRRDNTVTSDVGPSNTDDSTTQSHADSASTLPSFDVASDEASSRRIPSPSLLESFELDVHPDAKADEQHAHLDYASYISNWSEEPPEVSAAFGVREEALKMPAVTFRSCFLGVLFSMLMSAANTFLYFRFPAPFIFPIIAELLAYPIGRAMAATLPTAALKGRIGERQIALSLNGGPFSLVEHSMIIIMCNAAASTAYGLHVVVALERFFGLQHQIGFSLCLLLSQQALGYGVGGLLRRFLVEPALMTWPQSLLYCSLLNTLHVQDGATAELTSRRRRTWFVRIALAAAAWFFLPGYLFQALSTFSFVCWIFPSQVIVNQLFGVFSGLGMSMISFDWGQITYAGSPMIVPFHISANVFAGFVITFWIVTPIIYYTNTWYTAYMPILSSSIFDRFAQAYNVSRVFTNNQAFDLAAFEDYSSLYAPATFIVVYGIHFAIASAVLVHLALVSGPLLHKAGYRARRKPTSTDEFSWLVYTAVILVCTALAIVAVTVYDVHCPVWALLLSCCIGLLYVLPAGVLLGTANQQIAVNGVTELIGGYCLPHNPIGGMVFKSYTISMLQSSTTFAAGLKIAQYTNVSAKVAFVAQLVAVVLSTFIQIGMFEGIRRAVPDLCSPDQSAQLTCAVTNVYYNSSILWGLIGPSELFSPGKLYNALLWCLLAGALLPIPFWLWNRRYTKSWVRNVDVPVLLNGCTMVPPATGMQYASFFLVSLLTQYWIRRRHYGWWKRYNFVVAAGLDSGTALSIIVVFLTLQLPKGGTIVLDWWGNNVFTKTADWLGTPLKQVPAGGFGPSSW